MNTERSIDLRACLLNSYLCKEYIVLMKEIAPKKYSLADHERNRIMVADYVISMYVSFMELRHSKAGINYMMATIHILIFMYFCSFLSWMRYLSFARSKY